MRIGSKWTPEERTEIEALCQRNRELLLRMDFALGVERPLESLSARDISFLNGVLIEENRKQIEKAKEVFRTRVLRHV